MATKVDILPFYKYPYNQFSTVKYALKLVILIC